MRPTRLIALGIVVLFAFPVATSAQGSPRCNFDGSYPRGTVAALDGTPHLWVLDGGDLHWADDTRALAGRTVQWDRLCGMDLDFARRTQKGDPWLSAGLVKIGDPIYLPKWETEEPTPTLLHIQSIGDVELFGISGTNYGRFVLERAEWEARYGFSADALRRGELPTADATISGLQAPPESSAQTPAPALAQALPAPVPAPTQTPTPRVPTPTPPSTCTNPAANLSPSTVRPGDRLTLDFHGFAPGSTVTISLSSGVGPPSVTQRLRTPNVGCSGAARSFLITFRGGHTPGLRGAPGTTAGPWS